MKRYIALLLAFAALSLQACSASDDETEDIETETEIETEAETEAETAPQVLKPEEIEFTSFEELTLVKDPVYENGMMVLYFNENDVMYNENTDANIGVVAADEAYTVKAEIDFDSFPDMKVDESNYCGIALKPSFEIDPGEYRISITFDEYKVEFEMTIQ